MNQSCIVNGADVFCISALSKCRTLMEMRPGILREECVIKAEFLSLT